MTLFLFLRRDCLWEDLHLGRHTFHTCTACVSTCSQTGPWFCNPAFTLSGSCNGSSVCYHLKFLWWHKVHFMISLQDKGGRGNGFSWRVCLFKWKEYWDIIIKKWKCLAIEWNLLYETQRTLHPVTADFAVSFHSRCAVSLCTDTWWLSLMYHWGKNITVLTSSVSLWLLKYASHLNKFPVIHGVCLSFRGLLSLLCEYSMPYYPTLFLLHCYAFCFFDRLIEIAGNRLPTYFDSDEKLFCMTRSIHVYRDLTCGSVLKRYLFPELKKKKDHLDQIVYNNICFISKFYVE